MVSQLARLTSSPSPWSSRHHPLLFGTHHSCVLQIRGALGLCMAICLESDNQALGLSGVILSDVRSIVFTSWKQRLKDYYCVPFLHHYFACFPRHTKCSFAYCNTRWIDWTMRLVVTKEWFRFGMLDYRFARLRAQRGCSSCRSCHRRHLRGLSRRS